MKTCPLCQKPVESVYKPFCSARCQQADLGRWFAGSYAVAAGENEEEDFVEKDADSK